METVEIVMACDVAEGGFGLTDRYVDACDECAAPNLYLVSGGDATEADSTTEADGLNSVLVVADRTWWHAYMLERARSTAPHDPSDYEVARGIYDHKQRAIRLAAMRRADREWRSRRKEGV